MSQTQLSRSQSPLTSSNYWSHSIIAWFLVAVGLAIVSRVVPHAPNWTAVGALALWSGTLLRHKGLSLTLPILVLFLSDLVLGFHPTMAWVYLGFLGVGLLGLWIKPQQGLKNTLPGSFLGTLIFFIVSNFGVWVSGGLYPMTQEGLLTCFVMAIPFVWSQLAADFFFNGIYFGAYRFFSRPELFLPMAWFMKRTLD